MAKPLPIKLPVSNKNPPEGGSTLAITEFLMAMAHDDKKGKLPDNLMTALDARVAYKRLKIVLAEESPVDFTDMCNTIETLMKRLKDKPTSPFGSPTTAPASTITFEQTYKNLQNQIKAQENTYKKFLDQFVEITTSLDNRNFDKAKTIFETLDSTEFFEKNKAIRNHLFKLGDQIYKSLPHEQRLGIEIETPRLR